MLRVQLEAANKKVKSFGHPLSDAIQSLFLHNKAFFIKISEIFQKCTL